MHMKKVIAGVVMLFALATVVASAAFTPPTSDQIKAAAEKPADIKALLKDSTPEQASSVLLQVVRAVQGLKVKPEVKKQRVTELFAAVQEAVGKNAGMVIGDVAKRIPADLLPSVAAPGSGAAQPAIPIAQPLAPPIVPGEQPPPPPPPPVAPPYGGQ
jgi:hypothetical protein